jgi:hypothetical protein
MRTKSSAAMSELPGAVDLLRGVTDIPLMDFDDQTW